MSDEIIAISVGLLSVRKVIIVLVAYKCGGKVKMAVSNVNFRSLKSLGKGSEFASVQTRSARSLVFG